MREQFPLQPCWGCTIYKLQGTTLERAVVSIESHVFAKRMSYMALGRVKTVAGLYISEMGASKIEAPLVLEEYSRLANKAQVLKHLNIYLYNHFHNINSFLYHLLPITFICCCLYCLRIVTAPHALATSHFVATGSAVMSTCYTCSHSIIKLDYPMSSTLIYSLG